MGNAYSNINQTDSAIYHFKCGLSVLDEFYPNRNNKNYAKVYGQMLKLYFKQNLKKQANQIFNTAKNEIKNQEQYDIARYYEIYTKYFLENKYYDSASYYAHQALKLNLLEYKDASLFMVPSIHSKQIITPSIIKLVQSKAQALLEIYKINQDTIYLKAALNHFIAGCDMLEELMRGFSHVGSNNMLSKFAVLYEQGMSCAALLDKKLKTDQYKRIIHNLAERSKSIFYLQSIQQQRAMQFYGVPDSLVRKHRYLQAQLVFLEKNYHQAIEKKQLEDSEKWHQKTLLTYDKLDSLKAYIKKNHPSYYTIRYNNKPLTIKHIQKKLQLDSSIFVNYFWGEKNLFVIHYSPTRVNYFIVKNIDTMKQMLDSLTILVSTPPFTSKHAQDDWNSFQNLSHALFQKLLGSNNISKWPKLIISPDGHLHNFPFELLTISKKSVGDNQYNKLDYLVLSNAVKYAYSAKTFFEQKHINQKYLKDYVAFAPIYSRDKILPNTKEEINLIANKFKGQQYIGNEATLTNFHKVHQQCRMIHLAMHGYWNSETYTSKLIFQHGSALNNQDIYNLHIPAELVVLSACNTAKGIVLPGEGALSLGKAFQYAGCANVMMSQWKLPDQTALKLMGSFYKSIEQGITIEKALANAKRAHILHQDPLLAHPFYWAPLVLYGNHSDVYTGKSDWFHWKYFVGLSIITLLVLVYFPLKRRSQRK